MIEISERADIGLNLLITQLLLEWYQWIERPELMNPTIHYTQRTPRYYLKWLDKQKILIKKGFGRQIVETMFSPRYVKKWERKFEKQILLTEKKLKGQINY